MWGDLHESKNTSVKLPSTVSAGVANRLFKELGATLNYDVYSFEADAYEVWQSQSLINIELKSNGKVVDASEDFDEIILSYPFACRPSSDQQKALKLIHKITVTFSGKAIYQGDRFDAVKVQKDWDNCNDYLLKEWGEEPGSSELRRMIEENYA